MQFASRTLTRGQRPPSCLLRGAWRCSDLPPATSSTRSIPPTTASSLARARALAAASARARAHSSSSSSSGRPSDASARSAATTAAAAARATTVDDEGNDETSTSNNRSAAAPAPSATPTPCPWGVYGSLPPPPASIPAWDAARFGSGSPPTLDPRRRIYCNRSLNMRGVHAVGFDLDYTLASYRPETFEALAHAQTVAKLIECFGYPRDVLSTFGFEWRYMTRGLIMDKRRGNILKADRHKYVKVAYHGFKPLTRDERSATYNASPVRAEFDEPHYGVVDTLFSLAEAYLFMQLVELVDRDPTALKNANAEAAAAGKDAPGGYSALYRDVRAAVDLCHRDGSLKREVAADPARYIHADPHLVPMLRMLKRSGRRVFLATNSLWDYTNVVMNYLVGQHSEEELGGGGLERRTGGENGDGAGADGGGDGEGEAERTTIEWALTSTAQGTEEDDEEYEETEATSGTTKPPKKKKKIVKRTTEWLGLFDVVVVGCAKPGFFSERRPLFAVNPRDGTLRNTDNGAPITPIGEDEDPSGATAERSASAGAAAQAAAARRSSDSDANAEAPVFQGGNYMDLHRLLGVKSGAEVLYVGDHIYGDILRSKKTLGWRTMLVAPELEAELARLGETSATQRELRLLRGARAELDDRVQRLEWALKNGEVGGGGGGGGGLASSPSSSSSADRANLEAALADLRAQRDAVKAQHASLLKAHHESFHPVWGQLLKTGYQNSRFAHQVDRFACLYGAHAANLAFYSPEASHRAKCDALAHEQWGGGSDEGMGGFWEGGVDG